MSKKLLKSLFFLLLLSIYPYCLASTLEEDLFTLEQSSPPATSQTLPFQGKAWFDASNNIIHFEIVCSDGAYIYKESLNINTDKQTKIKLYSLPKPSVHNDALGRSEVYFGKISLETKVLSSPGSAKAVLSYRGCDSQGICYPPQELTVELPKVASKSTALETLSKQMQEESALQPSTKEQSFWALSWQLLLFLIMGAGLDLTPCVLPLLGIFSAMILGQGKCPLSKAFILNSAYLVGLTLTYTILGLVFASLGMSAHTFLSSPYLTATLALLLTILACDCLGLINLRPPKLFNNAIEQRLSSQKRGTIPSSFMFGLLSGIMTTPCTSAPLAGALLYITKAGDIATGTLMFASIGLGMGLPLCIIGLCGQGLIKKISSSSTTVKKLISLPLFWAAFSVAQALWDYQVLPKILFAAGIAFILCFILLSTLQKLSSTLKILSCTLYSACVLFVFSQTLPHPQELPFTPLSSLAELDSYASQDLVITFSASWCGNCHVMDDELYSKQEFKLLLQKQRLKALRFDLSTPNDPKVKTIAEHFEITGVPTAIIIKDGQEIARISGYNPSEVMNKMKIKH